MSRRERGPEPGPGGAEVAAEDAEPESPDQCLSLLPWDRFSAWLHCVCVVGFDLELGQAVEVRAAAGGWHRSPCGLRRGPGGIGCFLWPRCCTEAGEARPCLRKRGCAEPRSGERGSAPVNRLGCPG